MFGHQYDRVKKKSRAVPDFDENAIGSIPVKYRHTCFSGAESLFVEPLFDVHSTPKHFTPYIWLTVESNGNQTLNLHLGRGKGGEECFFSTRVPIDHRAISLVLVQSILPETTALPEYSQGSFGALVRDFGCLETPAKVELPEMRHVSDEVLRGLPQASVGSQFGSYTLVYRNTLGPDQYIFMISHHPDPALREMTNYGLGETVYSVLPFALDGRGTKNPSFSVDLDSACGYVRELMRV